MTRSGFSASTMPLRIFATASGSIGRVRRLDEDAAVGADGERGADRLLRLRRPDGHDDDLRVAALLLDAHRLFDGDLIEGVHRHLHVGEIDARSVRLDANFDVEIDDPLDRHQISSCRRLSKRLCRGLLTSRGCCAARRESAEPREKVPSRRPSFVIRKCEMRTYGRDECKSIGRRLTVRWHERAAEAGKNERSDAQASWAPRSNSGTPGRRMNTMSTAPAIRPPMCAHQAIGPRSGMATMTTCMRNPDAEHQARRDAQRDDLESQHPHADARMQHQVGGDNAGDGAAGADERHVAVGHHPGVEQAAKTPHAR